MIAPDAILVFDVGQISIHPEARSLASDTAPIIATDIGGTYARLGLVHPRAAGARSVDVRQFRQYVCADYPSLGAIVSDFLSTLDGERVGGIAIASAGYPLGDTMLQSNLPWPVSLAELRSQFDFGEFALINDFAAIAYGTQFLAPGDATLISKAAVPPARGPMLVMGPGTGLGAAVLLPGNTHPTVISTEAGQVAFAPTTDLEIDILKALRTRMTHVSIENVVSGPGLVNVHAALSAIRSERPLYRTPAEISAAALDDHEPHATQALEVFCGVLGSVAGQLTLFFGAHGGVHLAGGVLPRMKSFLLKSSFLERFLGTSPMRSLLERVPVKLIEHGQLGVIGAASWYFDNHQQPSE
ncbi:MAG TPA: glucokinase [Steroidobacteraceae bacterium]|nr:glucokinase [Steroidobacteraceae bacterium]